MKNRTFTTLIAIILHLCLAGILYATTQTDPPAVHTVYGPQDELRICAHYANQAASVAIYAQNAEIALNGRTYTLYCTPEKTDSGDWVALESPTGNEIRLGENGVTVARIEGKTYTFIPE
jgi:hypothetical protein